MASEGKRRGPEGVGHSGSPETEGWGRGEQRAPSWHPGRVGEAQPARRLWVLGIRQVEENRAACHTAPETAATVLTSATFTLGAICPDFYGAGVFQSLIFQTSPARGGKDAPTRRVAESGSESEWAYQGAAQTTRSRPPCLEGHLPRTWTWFCICSFTLLSSFFWRKTSRLHKLHALQNLGAPLIRTWDSGLQAQQ